MKKSITSLLFSVIISLTFAMSVSATLIPMDMSMFPDLFSNTTGTYTYNATTNLFETKATPHTFALDPATSVPVTGSCASYYAGFYVDENGKLQSGVSGNDLKITGKIDVDNDGTYDYTGTLLTGEITNFGYQYVTVGQSLFNFAFDVTGGALASLFPTEHDGTQLGGDYFTTENTNFNGSWLTSSYGYKVKHDTFPIPNPEPTTWILLLIGMIGMTTVTRKRVRL